MRVQVSYDSVQETIYVNNFYKEVAEKLVEIGEEPSKVVTFSVGDTQVTYEIKRRSGSIFIVEVSNNLPEKLIDHDIQARYLTCINPEKNAYKFYRLVPEKSEVKASWGRMGVNPGERFGEKSFKYPVTMYWVKYQEKLAKGYIDQTKLYIPGDEEKKIILQKKETKPQNMISNYLFNELLKFSKDAVRNAKVMVPITSEILKASNSLIDELRNASEIDVFNLRLLNLMSILQRPVRTGDGRGVKELMASSQEDFGRIILREENLLNAMTGVYMGQNDEINDFTRFNIEIYEANDRQRKQVMAKLNDTLKAKVKKIYRVIPREQQDKFDKYLQANNINDVKQYWHGSRNENWLSIIKLSLQLNPNATITGKMFGKGIYFAPSSLKSWNYTSFKGTSWANGDSGTAFMGLYATAYGKPYDVTSWSSRMNYDKKLIEQHNANCLHAHAGISLKNDEIIFYDEAACVLNYIVEFSE